MHIVGTGGRFSGPATLGGTTLKDSTANPSSETVLKVTGTSASTISGIDVSIPGGTGSADTGIETGGSVDNVIVHPVVGTSPSANPVGVLLDSGGSLTGSDVVLPLIGDASAVVVAGAPATVRQVGLTASIGVAGNAPGAPVDLAQARIEFGQTPVVATAGTVAVDDVLMVHRADSSAAPSGLAVNTSTSATLAVNHSTLIGAPNTGAPALLALNSGSGSATLTFRNGVITTFPVMYFRSATGSGPANITTDYSDYGGGPALLDSGPGAFTETNRLNVPPGFSGGTDYHLRPDSPLVDAGDPAPLASGEPVTDLAELPRIADGNGDCVARRDIGAFEFTPGPRAPRAVASAALAAGGGIAFDASLSCDPDGDALTFAWSFDDGGTASGASVQHGFATPGRHSGTVTVTDATGRATTATASATIPAPKRFAGVSIPKQRVKVSTKGVAKVRVKCPKAASGGCTGTLKLTAKLRKRVTIGSAKFTIKPGVTRAVAVKLSKAARARVKANGRLNAVARAAAKDASGITKVASRALVLQ